MNPRDTADDARLAVLAATLEVRTADLRALAAKLAPQALAAKGHVNGTGHHPDELDSAVAALESLAGELAAAREALARCVEERRDYKAACFAEIDCRLGDEAFDWEATLREIRDGVALPAEDVLSRLRHS